MRKFLAALLVAVGTLVAYAGPAAAQVAGDDEVVAPVWVIPAPLVTLLIGTFAPLVNGLLLRPSNPAWVKALVSNLFAAVVYAITQAVADNGAAILSESWFMGLVATLVVMAASYFGVWRPIVDPNRRVPTLLPVGDALTPKDESPQPAGR